MKLEVTDRYASSRVVDLESKTCSSRGWDLSGIPYCHVVAACNYMGLNSEDFFDEMLKKTTFLKTFSCLLNPINDKDLRPDTGLHDLLPPEILRLPRRPKKNIRKRVEEIEEGMQNGKLKRVGTRIKCSLCTKVGHNKMGCPKAKAIRSEGNYGSGRNPCESRSEIPTQLSTVGLPESFQFSQVIAQRQEHDLLKQTDNILIQTNSHSTKVRFSFEVHVSQLLYLFHYFTPP